MDITRITIPDDWDDNDLLLFEEVCKLIRTPQRTARDWRRRGIGPSWWRFNGTGRLYRPSPNSGASSGPVNDMATSTEPAAVRPRWLSISGAASWVSVSAKTIRRRIAAGDLRAYRCGKTIRVKTDDLEAMMRPVPSAKDW